MFYLEQELLLVGPMKMEGEQPTFDAELMYRMTCAGCLWSVLGALKPDGFCAQMETQRFPEEL